MKWSIRVFTIAAVFAVVQSESYINYSAQDSWPKVCTTGQKQSPINVITSNVQCNSQLTRLTLSDEYFQQVSGDFKNNGHSVDFTPDSNVNAVMTTPVGNYKLKSFHMHWGAGQGKGSEHLVNGIASELEVHFVHEKVNAQSKTASDYYAVLSVRGSMQYEFTYGIFSQLDVTRIVDHGTNIRVTGIYMSSLLPNNGDYYYYQGSLTTPDCNESVQWFLLKHRIAVPLTFLANLRKVRDNSKNRNPITANYRQTQPLNGRIVTQVC